jgi:hypothetical protein
MKLSTCELKVTCRLDLTESWACFELSTLSAGRVLSGPHKCQSVKDASSFFASGVPSGVVLIVGVALATEAASCGYGIGLVIVTVMAKDPA